MRARGDQGSGAHIGEEGIMKNYYIITAIWIIGNTAAIWLSMPSIPGMKP